MFGAVVMLIAYGLSVFLVERLFKIMKPKVLTMSWFAVIWTGFVEIRDNSFGWFRNNASNLVDLVGRLRA